MKRFMQMLLASFGVLALMLAGCSSTPAVEDEGTPTDDTTLEGSGETGLDTEVDVNVEE